MLQEKVKALIVALDQPRSAVSAARLYADLADIAAVAQEAGDVDAQVFALFPAEFRLAAFAVTLSAIAAAIR